MHDLYLPTVGVPSAGSPVDPAIAQLIALVNSPWQKRIPCTVNDILMHVAQAHAEEMADLNYASHVSPSGLTVNERIRNAGYVLPSYYDFKGNNCESLAAGYSTADLAIAALYNSPVHHDHITGDNLFWADQHCYGVGHAFKEASKYKNYFVFISAPCP